jgi:deoxyribodipyrimidine photo-lyase
MDDKPVNIVWLKKDLRLQDHEAFMAAEQSSIDYLIVYFFEPDLVEAPDIAQRHLRFIYHSLKEMNAFLNTKNRHIEIMNINAVEGFSLLSEHYDIKTIFSHQESGTQRSWNRDKQVKKWCDFNNVLWEEKQRDGIVRGITNRDNWDKQWYSTINQPTFNNQYTTSSLKRANLNLDSTPADFFKNLENYPKRFQPAGEKSAWKYLQSFTNQRGFNYSKHISKPTESRVSCGRISPYLAWGNISIKQAVHHIKLHPNYDSNKRAFNGILTRLKWHCHFIQKFEVECRYETECINKGYELLERPHNPDFIAAWKTGKTGYPMVDACMRAVIETGWINFRMRAMLVSFLCHHLDQDWREGVYFLARQFLDYEPGIHYPQFQMQAGTTGINTVRIYNPTKQSYDHDPKGVFIKTWIPELQNVPDTLIHEPHKMTLMEQSLHEAVLNQDYPSPIVNLQESGKKARSKIWGHRKNEVVKQENKRILAMHVRKNKKKKE